MRTLAKRSTQRTHAERSRAHAERARAHAQRCTRTRHASHPSRDPLAGDGAKQLVLEQQRQRRGGGVVRLQRLVDGEQQPDGVRAVGLPVALVAERARKKILALIKRPYPPPFNLIRIFGTHAVKKVSAWGTAKSGVPRSIMEPCTVVSCARARVHARVHAHAHAHAHVHAHAHAHA